MEIRKVRNLFKGDKVIWMVFFFLFLISAVEVYSASSELTYKGSFFLPILKHLGLYLLGFGFMLLTLNTPCRYFRIATLPLLIFAVVTLFAVCIMGDSTNDSNRWLTLLGVRFQPSEIAKGALVLATAQILSSMQTDDGADPLAFKYILGVCLFIVPLIMVENLSTAALLSTVVFMMMVVGRVPGKQLGGLMGVVALALMFVFILVMTVGNDGGSTSPGQDRNMTEQLKPQVKEVGAAARFKRRLVTWNSRFHHFFDNTEVPPSEVDLDRDGQVAHANIAIVSSNVVGRGPGNSVERDFLSQAFSDFIYAIIIEELGLEGGIFVAFLYLILLFRTARIASRCVNSFPAFLAMGLALLLVTQALFNMCVAVGLVPVTGQPLPLISKGGTSTVINCVYLGAILSISRWAKRRDAEPAENMTEKVQPADSN